MILRSQVKLTQATNHSFFSKLDHRTNLCIIVGDEEKEELLQRLLSSQSFASGTDEMLVSTSASDSEV